MLVTLSLPLSLVASALLVAPAGAGTFSPDVSPTVIASTHSTFAAYGPDGYAGLAMLDGSPTASGGATLVVRYVMAGQEEPAWLEGVTVDDAGQLVAVVRREGRRIRTLTVTADGIDDVVTEGSADSPLSSVAQDTDAALTSPWLVGLSLVAARPRATSVWTGALVDGSVRAVSPATLTCTGKHDVGSGRVAFVARLVPQQGSARTFIYDDGGVSAIIQPQDGLQWVAAPAEQIQATHDKTLD